MQERFKLVPCGYVFLVRDNKILLGRRRNTGYKDGEYGLPAGHIEDGETFKEGAAREAKEEAGVEILPEDLELKVVMQRKGGARIDLFFEPKKWSGEVVNGEPEKCDDLSWFPIDSLPANTMDYMREAIECWQNGTFYSEVGWE
ncbi:NUDIX domain-containing protein [Acetobacteraceae bacterium]|nr:NUDIX domain-containing protein [Candidatus Parcubacteria bacterium]